MHAGIDIGSVRSSREDEPIYSVKSGTVTLVSANTPGGSMAGYGNAVVIRHDGGKYALYAHMKDGSVSVAPGQTVQGGQRIGSMGNTTNGSFSPLPGESVAAFTARARARGYRSGPMNRHLHFELRTARPDGSSPFPGPYPRSPEQALHNLDPGPWFNEMGLFFSSRGSARVNPGTTMDQSRARWTAAMSIPPSSAMAGTLAIMGLDGAQIDSLGQVPAPGYEPPEDERDVKWGLTKVESRVLWGTGIVAATALVIGLVASLRRLRPNRRKGARSSRLRTWGSK